MKAGLLDNTGWCSVVLLLLVMLAHGLQRGHVPVTFLKLNPAYDESCIAAVR
jgi:hypothetical protein